MKFVFATHNQGKVIEMRNILAGFDCKVVTAQEVGVLEDVVEDGETFEENALKKARFVCEKTNQWVIADDSGLCIDALDGTPGVYTARWAGENATGEQMIAHTLMKMEGKENRSAHFESAIVIVAPDGRHWTFTGIVKGTISLEPKGTARLKLPYDVIFVPEGCDKTFAEMSDEQKNSMSHRGKAFEALKTFIQKNKNLFEKEKSR